MRAFIENFSVEIGIVIALLSRPQILFLINMQNVPNPFAEFDCSQTR